MFIALIAAVGGTIASLINPIATIFTLDLYAKYSGRGSRAEDEEGSVTGSSAQNERHLVMIGRLTSVLVILIAAFTARPLLGGSDKAFQFVQEFSGFFTAEITVIASLVFPAAAGRDRTETQGVSDGTAGRIQHCIGCGYRHCAGLLRDLVVSGDDG